MKTATQHDRQNDPDLKKLDDDLANVQAAYEAWRRKFTSEVWVSLRDDALQSAMLEQQDICFRRDRLLKQRRNLMEERYGEPNLEDEIDRLSRFLAWLDNRTIAVLSLGGNDLDIAQSAVNKAFAKAVEFAGAAQLSPPPKPGEITNRANADHYILELRQWSKQATAPMEQSPAEVRAENDNDQWLGKNEAAQKTERTASWITDRIKDGTIRTKQVDGREKVSWSDVLKLSAKSPRKGGKRSVQLVTEKEHQREDIQPQKFPFRCQKCSKQFEVATISDEPKCCPHCKSENIGRIGRTSTKNISAQFRK